MKLKQIALLVSGLTLSASAFAAPVTQTQIEAARVAGTLQQAWISGATAPTINIYEGWVGSGAGVGCDPGTNTIFTSQAGGTTGSGANVKPGSIGNFLAYACTRAGVVSVLYHVLDGGSLLYVQPHTLGTKLARLKYVGTSTCLATQTYTDATNPDNNATVLKGCTLVGSSLPSTGATSTSNAANKAAVEADTLAPSLPVGGFSDVESTLWPSSIGGGNVSSKGVQKQANIGQVFGVVASVPLYRAMQAAQGVSATDITADTTFDPAIAPSITAQQYVSIIAQGGAYQNDWSPIVGAAGVGKKVILARRVVTSGTQASSTAFFLKNPCTNAVIANLTPATAADSTPSYEVFEGSSTGNIKTRISTAAVNTGTENFAIGVMSVENDWRAEANSATNGYRFLKINGVHPEGAVAGVSTAAEGIANGRLTATNGLYPFHMEATNFVRSNYAGAPVKTAFESVVVGQISSALSAPPASSCAVLPRGLTLNPLGGSICDVGLQQMKGTVLGNNCSPYQLTQ